MTVATISDWTRHRYLFTLLPTLLALAGFASLMTIHHSLHTEYGMLFLAAAGTYSAMPVIVCWFQANLGGKQKDDQLT